MSVAPPPSRLSPYHGSSRAEAGPIAGHARPATPATASSLGGRVIAGRYVLRSRVGSGSFGEVYSGIDNKTGQKVAVKLEALSVPLPQLQNEARMYRSLQGVAGVPQVHWCGTDSDFTIMVMDLLGPSLGDLLESCGGKFSLRTVAVLAEQLLHRIEHVHAHNLLHRDVKPDNFCMGTGDTARLLHILDFGCAKIFKDQRTREHIQFQEGKSMVGTARYASIATHRGMQQSRRDDLEAIGYMLLHFLRGRLPWQGLQATCVKERMAKIAELKISTPIPDICQGFPKEFETYLNYCRSLDFKERPDYSFARGLFRSILARQPGNPCHIKLDWEEVGKADKAPIEAAASPIRQVKATRLAGNDHRLRLYLRGKEGFEPFL